MHGLETCIHGLYMRMPQTAQLRPFLSGNACYHQTSLHATCMQHALPHAHLTLVQKRELHAPYPRRHIHVACAWPPSGRLHARMEKGLIAQNLHATYTYDTCAWIHGERRMKFGRISAVYHPRRNLRSLGGRRMSMTTHARLVLSSLKYNMGL